MGRGHYHYLVVNLKGEGTYFLYCNINLLFFLCHLKLSLTWDSFCFDPKGQASFEVCRTVNSAFFSLPAPTFALPQPPGEKIFSHGPARTIPSLTSQSLLLGYICVLAWETCFQRPDNPAFGKLLLFFTNSVSQSIFHENTSASTCLAMMHSMVKYWGNYIPFLEIHNLCKSMKKFCRKETFV